MMVYRQVPSQSAELDHEILGKLVGGVPAEILAIKHLNKQILRKKLPKAKSLRVFSPLLSGLSNRGLAFPNHKDGKRLHLP